MSLSTYFPQYKAMIETKGLTVEFSRLSKDRRDQMSDSVKPEWEPVDDFKITIKKIAIKEYSHYTGHYFAEGIIEDKFEVATTDKQLANYIWWLAKHGTTYEQFKAMHEAKQF